MTESKTAMSQEYYSPLLQRFAGPEKRIPVDVDWRGGLLVRSTNWLGDALMTLPAVSQMRRHVPSGCGLHVLSPRNLAPIWRACPFVDGVVEMSEKRITSEEVCRVRDLGLGVSMVLPNSFGSAMDIWKTGVPVRAGRRGRWRRMFLTHSMREWPRGENVGVCHQLSYYLELAEMLGDVALSASCPPLSVSPELASELGMEADVAWLAVAPGAAYGPAKQWPAEYFSEVAAWWMRERGRVVLLGGGKEKEVADQIASSLPEGVLNLAGKTDLGQLMSVLAASSKVVANDSGAMHLAAGLGCSGVALFGSTDPVATGPIGGRWKLLVSDAPCRPCFKRECPRVGDDAYTCLRGLKPERVIEMLDS